MRVRGEWVLSALQSAEEALEALLVALEQLCQTVGTTVAAYSLPHTDMHVSAVCGDRSLCACNHV